MGVMKETMMVDGRSSAVLATEAPHSSGAVANFIGRLSVAEETVVEMSTPGSSVAGETLTGT